MNLENIESTKLVNGLQPNNPFAVIEHEKTHRVKVWDFLVECEDEFCEVSIGRVRILALVPKKPEPLENIKFSVAWCNPSDVKHFDKNKANKILVGRFLSCFIDGRSNINCGLIPKLDTLKNFHIEAFNALILVPQWMNNATRIIQRTSQIDIYYDDLSNKFVGFDL